jgi:hypothetical protein
MILTINPSAAIPFDCTPNGIKKCQGKCCTNLPSYWPQRAYDQARCPHLSPTGCKLTEKDRPIDCLIYPFFINDNGTLVVHNHCYHKKWFCHENLRLGPPLIVTLEECLTELFGKEQYRYMRDLVLVGKSYTFKPLAEFTYCRMVEDLCIKYDLPIIPRGETIKDFHERGTKLLELMEENVARNNLKVSPHYRRM